MDRSESCKSAPSLDVFAPTSQLAAARTRKHDPIRSKSNRGRGTNSSTSSAGSTHFDTIDRSIAGNEYSEYSVDFVGVGGLSANSEDGESEEQASILSGVISGLPSWMVSLSVHLALLLILAICSLGVGTGPSQFEIEFVDASDDFETFQTEIEFENVVMEDELDQLEPDQTEISVSQDIAIPLEMMEFVSLNTELVSTDDFGPVIDLPGSTTTRSGQKGKSAKFFGTESNGSKFVFVIDCSLSMKGRRWYRAVKELNDAIDGLGDDQDFLVLLYNNGTSVMMDLSKDSAALVSATPDNKEGCRRWLRKQKPNGGTFPATAMFNALILNPDAVFMLSDGELQDNTRGLLQFWNVERPRAEGTYAKIPINTVSLGGRGQGQNMMKSIAEQNDGKFTWIQ